MMSDLVAKFAEIQKRGEKLSMDKSKLSSKDQIRILTPILTSIGITSKKFIANLTNEKRHKTELIPNKKSVFYNMFDKADITISFRQQNEEIYVLFYLIEYVDSNDKKHAISNTYNYEVKTGKWK